MVKRNNLLSTKILLVSTEFVDSEKNMEYQPNYSLTITAKNISILVCFYMKNIPFMIKCKI